MSESLPTSSRRPQILVLSLHYKPEPNFITTAVAERLATRSDVVVVTAHPNYPLGRFYSGERFPRIRKTVENGVRVWRLPYFTDHSLSIARRGLSYLSFAGVAAVLAPFVARRPDTVWVYHGPFTTALAALFFKIVHRSRLVITCADLWPESFVASGVVRNRALFRLAAAYNRLICRRADLLICATKGTMQAFREMGIPEERLMLIPVWIDGVAAVEHISGREPAHIRRIVYAGNLGPAQALETVIEAAAMVREEIPDLRFAFYGAGASENALRQLAETRGATNAEFFGRVSPEEAFLQSASSTAQIVTLQRSELFKRTVPSKLYLAFAASAPLLYGLEGEAAELAAQSGGGIAFDSMDPASLVEAVKTLLARSATEDAQMRANLRAFFKNYYDPQKLIAKYESVLLARR